MIVHSPHSRLPGKVSLPKSDPQRETAVARARGRELLLRMGLTDRIDFASANLSGGQKQRVAVARALMNRP